MNEIFKKDGKCYKYFPYYENDPNITDPNSNYNQTWRNIIPFLSKLNSLSITLSTNPIPIVNPIVNLPIVTLTRKQSTAKETIGEWRTNDKRFGCDSLELSWKNNQRNISSIPTGQYICKWTFSPKFLKYTYEVKNVPNRSGIRIHSSSFWFNLAGCISLGSLPKDINNDGEIDLQNSRLLTYAFENYMEKKDFILVIR